MPKYEYDLIEETVLSVVIEADSREEADEKAENLICEGDLDWGMGGMDVKYEFQREYKDA